MSLFSELKRRNVLRAGAAYIVTAWLLIQVAETVFPLFGFGDAPARIIVIVLLIGFIPAMVLSWAFELTPQGWQQEQHVDHSQPVVARAAKRLDRIIMVVLAIGIAYFAVDKFIFAESRERLIAERAREAALLEAQETLRSNTSMDRGDWAGRRVAGPVQAGGKGTGDGFNRG